MEIVFESQEEIDLLYFDLKRHWGNFNPKEYKPTNPILDSLHELHIHNLPEF